MNYQDHMLNGGDRVLEEKTTKRGDIICQCPICECFRPHYTIVSCDQVSKIDSDWICDGCWTDLQRHLVPMADGDDPATGPEWHMLFRMRAGEPDSEIEHFLPTVIESLEREKRRLEMDGDPRGRSFDINVKIDDYKKGLPARE